MSSDQEIEARFWKALKSDRTIMLGSGKVPARPMTALLDGDGRGPLWIFTARQNELAGEADGADVFAAFVAKGHDTFASLLGRLSVSNDRAMIDKLWNPFVAAWYPDGKDDPDLVLMRFDIDSAEIWIDGSSLLAGVKILLGIDPKSSYADKVAKVEM